MRDHGDDPLPSPSPRHRQPGGGRGSYRQNAGAHRVEGLAGPTRRYALIVLVLVVMTSLPVLAAISAGSSTINGSALPGGVTPFIPQPSDGPVVVPLPPSALPTRVVVRVGDPAAALTGPWQPVASAGAASRSAAAGPPVAAPQSAGGNAPRPPQRPVESAPQRGGASREEPGQWCEWRSRPCSPTPTPPRCFPLIPTLPMLPALLSEPWWPIRGSASPSCRSTSPGAAPNPPGRARGERDEDERAEQKRARTEWNRTRRATEQPAGTRHPKTQRPKTQRAGTQWGRADRVQTRRVSVERGDSGGHRWTERAGGRTTVRRPTAVARYRPAVKPRAKDGRPSRGKGKTGHRSRPYRSR